MTAWTSTPPLLLFGLPHAVTLCGWLLPGPVISVPFGAPRPTAICAAVLPLPYRLETSAFVAGVPACAVQLAVPVPAPPVRQWVHFVVVLLGLTPACVLDDAAAPACFDWPGDWVPDCACAWVCA